MNQNNDRKYIINYINYIEYLISQHSISVDYGIYEALQKIVENLFQTARFSDSLRIPILDLACGDGSRTIEFINWFLEEKKDNLRIFGYDANKHWKHRWRLNMFDNKQKFEWLDVMPLNFRGIIFCSHCIYYSDLREQIFKLFDNSPQCPLLVIRAIPNDEDKCVMYKITKTWNANGVYNWQEHVTEWAIRKGYSYEHYQDVEIKAIVPMRKLSEFTKRFSGFVSEPGKIQLAYDIMRQSIGLDPEPIDNEPQEIATDDETAKGIWSWDDRFFFVKKK